MKRNPSQPDRRRTPRGGRRASDWKGKAACPSCANGDKDKIEQLSSGARLLWFRCGACGEVWRGVRL